MPQPLEVVPAAVHAAGGSVDSFAASHSTQVTHAHGAMEGSQAGVPVAAAVALRAALSGWSTQFVSLRSRMIEFGGALQGFAEVVTANDETSGAAFGATTGAMTGAQVGVR